MLSDRGADSRLGPAAVGKRDEDPQSRAVVGERDVGIVQLHDRRHEAQSEAAAGSRAAEVQAIESIEDPGAEIDGNSGSVIGDLDGFRPGRLLDRDTDRRPRRAVAYGVL